MSDTVDGPSGSKQNPLADAPLLEKVKASDMDAFRTLFERYQPMVFRHVLVQSREQDLAHDIVQETFIALWEHRSSLKTDRSLPAFLLRISGNLVRDAARYRRTRERLDPRIPPPALSEGDDPAEALQLAMLESALVDILNNVLPVRCRTIFLLSRFERKSHRDIAVLLGVSVRTVENQINKALKILHKRLGKFIP